MQRDIEQIVVVNENDQIVGSALRHEVLANHMWRRAAGGMVFDPKSGHILCHQRSAAKDERAGVWVATYGGKCSLDETPQHAAKRELNEEFGLDLPSTAFAFEEKFKSEIRHQFEYLFTVAIPGDWNTIVLKLQDEVADYKWCSLPNVRRNLNFQSDWYSYGYEEKLLASIEQAITQSRSLSPHQV